MSATTSVQVLLMSWATWSDALLHAAWKAIPLLAVAWIATTMMKRTSASNRHLVWFSALIGVLILPLLSVTLPEWHVLPSWPNVSGVPHGTQQPAESGRHDIPNKVARVPVSMVFDENHESIGHNASPTGSESRQVAQNSPDTATITAPARHRQSIAAASFPWRLVITLLWLTGAVLVGLRTGLGMVSLWLLERRSERVEEGPHREILNDVCQQLGVRDHVRLLHSDGRSMPLTWGVVTPRVVLPMESSAWPAERCRAILLHEVGHIKRRDYIGQMVTDASCALHWFNPLVWVAARHMISERESACDDFVLHAGVRASEYAEHLLYVISKLNCQTRIAVTGVAMARTSPIEDRVASILNGTKNRTLLTKAKMIWAFVILFSVSAAAAMASHPAEDTIRVETAKRAEPSDSAQATLDASEKERALIDTEGEHTPSSSRPYPPSVTEADRIVAAARARTFGLHDAPRISLRSSYWNADVIGMQDVSERSINMLWRARGRDVRDTMRRETNTALTLAWDGHKLLIQSDSNRASDAAAVPMFYTQSRYWDGNQGWLGEGTPKERRIYRYAAMDKLMDGVGPYYFPHWTVAGPRLPWGGPPVTLDEYGVDPSLTRYEFKESETIDAVECNVYDGPARHERLWIEKKTGLVKAMCRQYLRGQLPNYYTELIEEVAGRTFAGAGEYRRWAEAQPTELRAKLTAFWAAVHWPRTEPGNLSVFSDYREIVPGVHWPMQCERIVVHSAGRGADVGYQYIRAEVIVTDVARDLSIEELASGALPQEGDPVVDRRFDPSIDYPWKKTLQESELRAAWKVKLEEHRKEEEAERKINETPIRAIADAVNVLTEGPKVDPPKIWARAIKYLVDHREEALPALIKQLDAETRDHPISKLAFALRAIGDKRAVPALIRALPRTLLPGRSDFGMRLDDEELCTFMQQHDQRGKVRDGSNYFGYGRAFREVVSALRRLTGQDCGEMQLNWVSLAPTDLQRYHQRRQYHRFAQRWSDWWEANWESMDVAPEFAKVDLAPLPERKLSPKGNRGLPSGPGVSLVGQSSGHILKSVHESDTKCFIDLDTAREAGWPVSLGQLGKIGLDSPKLLAWAREEGFDMVGVSHTPDGESKPLFCLKPIDMQVWKITEQEHRALHEAMAGKSPYPLTRPVSLMVPRRKIPRPYDYEFSGDAFLILTREGTAGLIRMTAQVTDTNLAGGASFRDSIFHPVGFYRGAKFSWATMTEPSNLPPNKD